MFSPRLDDHAPGEPEPIPPSVTLRVAAPIQHHQDKRLDGKEHKLEPLANNGKCS